MARTILPFGPQHPVLPEPLHLKLTVEDETVIEALPTLGYVHRGLEKLCEIRDFNQMIQIVERVCGICSCLHALCYCEGLEQIMGVEVPPRAKYLRTIWGELHRMHSHLLWLGLFADAFGFESLFMQFWRIRERIMDIMEATCGNRVVVSVNVIGGTRRDLSPEQCQWIEQQLAISEKELKQLSSTILNDYTVKKRTVGKGVLTKEQAYQLGAAGPTLRGSGWAQDARQTGYAAFGELGFDPIVEYDGDSYARSAVRFRETLQSIDLVRLAIARMPAGETATNIEGALGDDTPRPITGERGDIMQAYKHDKRRRTVAAPPPNLDLPSGHVSVKVKGKPDGEAVTRVEQPRGELLYYLKANGSKYMDRVRIRTPTFANIPPLLAMLPGCELADVPVLVLSIDPCISCTER
ncbi:NADH-ubiquinone oxidoreductase chain 49kDa [Solidesulfovibrio fructosivorans JJ]]|uniref:NADH-ubiquinone oxidoreductase chain 49kDa n=1 Tax=Solidesulfovibrio fructosivorans JJ] TaxID=596151 RepID=E1JZ51_SOLFR|nr:nickel-dependent hydrogenase large subunit [Solidesulfovibrio fructosivorans]EFL50334.1 NADH-ubiquinone oxidoreductase chain 49kDa [Solidesulfovibrio fructosivorans JJ]]